MTFLNVAVNLKKSGVIKTIDRTDYFKLANPGTSRPDLYNFALALGFSRGYPTEIEGAKESFVREEYVNNARYIYSSIYFSEYVNQGHKDEVDNLIYAENTFALADQFANTGFSVLKDLVENEPEETLTYKLIQEMDEIYEKIKDELKNI